MTQKLAYRFELKCIFDGVIFIWPPDEEPPLEGYSEYDALMSRPIMCPGDPEKMIPPHIEFEKSDMMEPRDIVEILNVAITER